MSLVEDMHAEVYALLDAAGVTAGGIDVRVAALIAERDYWRRARLKGVTAATCDRVMATVVRTLRTAGSVSDPGEAKAIGWKGPV